MGRRLSLATLHLDDKKLHRRRVWLLALALTLSALTYVLARHVQWRRNWQPVGVWDVGADEVLVLSSNGRQKLLRSNGVLLAWGHYKFSGATRLLIQNECDKSGACYGSYGGCDTHGTPDRCLDIWVGETNYYVSPSRDGQTMSVREVPYSLPGSQNGAENLSKIYIWKKIG